MSDKGATKVNEYVEKLISFIDEGAGLLTRHERIYSPFYKTDGKKMDKGEFDIARKIIPLVPPGNYTAFVGDVNSWLRSVYLAVSHDKDYKIAFSERNKLGDYYSEISMMEGNPISVMLANNLFFSHYASHPIEYRYTHGIKVYETAIETIKVIVCLIDILQGGRVDSVSESHSTRKIHKGKEEFTGLTIHTPEGTTWGDISFVVHEEWASITVTPKKPDGEKISHPKIAFNKLGFKSNIKLENDRLVPGYLWGFFINTVAISAEKGYPVPKSQFSKGLKKYTSELRTLFKKIFPDIPYDSYARSVDNPIPYDFGLKKWMPRFQCKRDFEVSGERLQPWE